MTRNQVVSGSQKSIRLPVFVIAALATAVLLAIFLSPVASTAPDGLEKVAATHGFAGQEKANGGIAAVLDDYAFPGLEGRRAKAAAGVTGTLAVFGAACLLAKIVYRRSPNG